MDNSRFDALVRALSTGSGPRRRTLGILAAGALGLLTQLDREDAEAKDCKKIKNKKKRKKCLDKAKSPTCGGVTCPEGRVCCPDERCGRTCCANGRACDVTCCGPNGNDYCCDASRPVCICGGCWQAGSTQCAHPKHCCSPGQRCCGAPPYDHCCAEGWECWMGCGGDPESAACCKDDAATCCKDGHRVF